MELTHGKRISCYRKQKNMTQEDLAQKLGVTSQAVSKWETDGACPDISLLPQLTRLLGVSVDTLLSGEPETGLRVLPPEQRKDPKDLMLRIVVDSKDGDQVRGNLPLSLVEVLLESQSMHSLPGGNALSSIDLREMLNLVRQGAVGNLVEVEAADGDTVHVFVE